MSDTQAELAPLNVLKQVTLQGPAFIGFIVGLSLDGIRIAQTIFYYRSFPRDGKVKKLMVLLLKFVLKEPSEYPLRVLMDGELSIADLVQTIVLLNIFWEILLGMRLPGAHGDTSPGKSPKILWEIELCHSGSFAISALITLVVQGVWRVSRGNVALLAAISIPSLMQGMGVVYVGTNCDEVIGRQVNLNAYIVSLPSLANFVCDGTIAGSLTYYFRSYRVGMPRFVATTRLLTGLSWVLFMIDPASSRCSAPLFIVNKLYVNSMMANLNSRRHFRAVVERTIDYSMHASAFDTARVATE
ncbi:hypothetical protein FIBSPDRAFT_1041120 [Athelia psychrophila]|uniref:DUF6534 domain-containing protein n=1 Tax=Athelia psychrophila TaxID=1759441 RepID=A0A166PGH3_9AGAM|nr:hypothetical protein FIBSPDRAFT_1041120 [Fibularhizoctonia sp. CBS 109695]